MSSIVKYSTSIKQKDVLIQACDLLNMQPREIGSKIQISNHGLKTYGNIPIHFIQNKNSEYDLVADFDYNNVKSQKELELLGITIKKEYSKILVVNTAKKLGFYQENITKNENGTIKIVLAEY